MSVIHLSFRNANHLCEALKEMWNELAPEFISSLTRSMQNRILVVFETDGGVTSIKYFMDRLRGG